jgi:hypothetical protein
MLAAATLFYSARRGHMTAKKTVEAPSAGDSPGTADSSPSPVAPGSFRRLLEASPFEPGPAEVLQLLAEVQTTMGRAFDDLLDACFWADRVGVANPYEVGVIRRCAEHAQTITTHWMRRCEEQAKRRAVGK